MSQRTWSGIESLWIDVRHAARLLRTDRTFSATVILTLALGIGANTAIFSVCDAVLLKPLRYTNPDRVVMLWERQENGGISSVAPGNFVDWRDQSRSFASVAAIDPFPTFVLTGSDEPARLAGARVSANFFSLLGTAMALGRGFVDDNDRPGASRVVVLSHGTWTQRLGGRPDIIGRSIPLNDQSYTVVGVLPRDFELVSRASDFQARDRFDVWIPLGLDLQHLQRNTHPLRVFARLAPGVALEAAQADLDVIAANLARRYPESNTGLGVAAVPLLEHVTGQVRAALKTLLGAVGLVLLIACANVANLLLGRAAARRQEMAVRVALGATPRQLASQLLTESLLLAAAGGTLGLLLASAAIRTLTRYLPADLPRASGIGVDARVLIFTAAIALATGVLFGLAPIVQAQRAEASEALKQGGRLAGGMPSRMRSGLVVAQMAIAVVLLVGAGLVAKSFWTLTNVAPGFRTDHTLTARLSLSATRYPDARRVAAFQRKLLDRIQSSPGIQASGLTAYLPLSGTDNAWGFDIERQPPLPVGEFNIAKYRPVSAGFFETIGIPLRQGRTFRPQDDDAESYVVVINESMARRFWAGGNPIGQRIQFGKPIWRTVIGIVGDVHHAGLADSAAPEMYVPFAQSPNNELRTTVVLRTTLDTAAAATSLRRAVSAIDAGIPIDNIETMEQRVSASLGQPRFRTALLAAFAILALAMASIGMYGVMNYTVVQRTRELGIRVAIGASTGDVLRLVLGRAAALIAVGLALGLLGAVGLSRFIASLLYGVTPFDALTFAAVSIVLSAVALFASYIPARRAATIAPTTALRCE